MKQLKYIFYLTVCLLVCGFMACGSVYAAAKLLLAGGSAVPSKMFVGQTYTIRDSENADVYYTTSDEKIAKIDRQTGVLTLLNPGTVSIYSWLQSGDKQSATKSVEVLKRAESVALNYAAIYFCSNSSGTFSGNGFEPALTATLTPSDTTDLVRLQSSDRDVATVAAENGVVSPKGNGAAVITAYALPTAATSVTDPENKTASAAIYVHAHNYQGTYKYKMSDSFYHYAVCKNDGCTITDDAKQYLYAEHDFLTVNGTKYCKQCNYSISAMPEHTHVWQSEYAHDGLRHWLVCENTACGATKSPQMHNFGADNKCTVCGAVHEHNTWETLPSLDAAGHWYACSQCDARKEYAAHHASDTEADCKTSIVCDACGAAYAKGAHVPSDEWSYNDYKHYKDCTVCSAKNIISENHTFAVADSDHVKCTVCNQVIHTHSWGAWQQLNESGHTRTCTQSRYDPNGKLYWFETESGEHTYDENNVCTVCGYAIPHVPTLKNGFYEIETVSDLKWFASKVNGGESHLNAILVNNLDMTDAGNVIIGKTEAAPFAGIFDGNGKKLTSIHFTVSQDCFGLFGVVAGGTVKNLTVSGSVELLGVSSNAYERIGGVVGSAKGGALLSNIVSEVNITCIPAAHHIGGVVGSSAVPNSGALKIEKCMFAGRIQAPYATDCIGGILGYANRYVTIANCGFSGQVTAGSGGFAGGILGYVNSASFGGLTDCFSTGTSSGTAIVGYLKWSAPNIENNVVLTGAQAYGGPYASSYIAHEVTKDDFASGKVTWLLNRGVYDGTQVWYQELGTQGAPSFTGQTVYIAENNIFTNKQPDTLILADGDAFSVLYVNSRCVLVLASYKSGRLIDVKISEVSCDESVTVAETGLITDCADTVKAMIFGDMRTIVPICEGAVITTAGT